MKVQIRKLKKPFFEEILNTKKDLLLAKTSVDKSWQNFLKIKRKLKLLHLQSKEKVQLSKMEINNLRKELKELNQKNKDHKHNNKLHKKNKKKEQKKLSKENKLHQLIKNLKKDNKEIALNFKKKLKLEFLRIDKESQNYNTDIKKKIKNNNLEIQIFKKSLWSQKNINQKEELKTKIQKLKIKNQEMESQLISQHFYISELKINKKQDYKEKCKNLKNKIFKLKEEYKHFEPSQDKYQEYLESLAVWKYSINERVLFFSKMTGIDKYLKRKPAALSGGQRQRIALVRAISKNVKMFLFDEPLSNLDAKLRGSMRTEIKALHKNLGTTSIFVTHDQVEATTMSDRIVLMNRGYIQQIGTPHELFFEPANVFTSDFIGSPRINLISAKLVSTNSIQFGSRKFILFPRKK